MELKILGNGQLKEKIAHFLTKLQKLQIVPIVATVLNSTLLQKTIQLSLKQHVST